MEDLQVPTRRIAVEILTADGDHLYGSLFAPEPHYRADRVDSLLRVLDDERAFLPFSVDGNERHNLLVNKTHIVRVRLTTGALPPGWSVDAPLHPATPDAGSGEGCTLVLADGERLSGRLAVHGRDACSRLLDKLNELQRFLPLVTDSGIELVQRDYVVRVE